MKRLKINQMKKKKSSNQYKVIQFLLAPDKWTENLQDNLSKMKNRKKNIKTRSNQTTSHQEEQSKKMIQLRKKINPSSSLKKLQLADYAGTANLT
jgi:hypothetical protein